MKKFALFALSAAALLSGCVETEEPGGGEIVVKAAFSTDREFYVAGDEVAFTDETAVENATVSGYEWNFGIETEESLTKEKNPVVLYPDAGTFLVSLTVSTVEGETDTYTQEIVVNRKNLAPEASFTYAPEQVTEGAEVLFTDTSADEVEGSIVSWLWDFDDGATSEEQNPRHTFAASGSYTVRLTVTDSDGASSETSATIEVSPKSIAEIVWQFDFADGGRLIGSSPAVGDKYVYVLSTAGDLVAVDRTAGTEEWRFDFISNGVSAMSTTEGASPSVDPADGSVVVAVGGEEAEHCRGFKLDGETGAEIWHVDWPNKGSRIPWLAPVITDKYVAVANRATSGSSYVWDKSTGKKVASSKLTGVGGGICATKADQFFFAGTGSNGFLPIWYDNSQGKWAVIPDKTGAFGYGEVNANGVQPMVDSRGYLYVGSAGDVWCFDTNGYDGTSDPKLVWKADKVTGGQICKGAGLVISADGSTLYAGSQAEEVFALSATDGSKLWSLPLDGKVQTVPAIDNQGNIHVCDHAGNYTIVSSDGRSLFAMNLGEQAWSSPAIADDGIVYVAAEKEGKCTLYAFKVEGVTSAADSDWSQFGGNQRRTGVQK